MLNIYFAFATCPHMKHAGAKCCVIIQTLQVLSLLPYGSPSSAAMSDAV